MVFEEVGQPLRAVEREIPRPATGQLLLRVRACGVCRTDLHLLDGEVDVPEPPRILGHQIVATVEPGGRRVGVPWLGWTCGVCEYCRSGRENLCVRARFTGRDIDGGYAEYAVADERFCFDLPGDWPDLHAAPLLCAGLIGYRALGMCGDARRLGLYGFGAAAHIIAQVARWQGRRVFAFTRAGDEAAQALAREVGAEWAGASDAQPPEPLDAAIIFAPVGALVPVALTAVAAGGTVVCGGIHMSDIPAFPYARLWGERVLRSVANLTRADGTEFLALAPRVPVHTHVTTYALEDANEALADLREGRLVGAAVVVP
ncbi:MAG: alcohol dehydrogenase, propanol-preferring [Solirubrobacteraceae bacterium]|nr:alcohol dehydrogenase, propanol-preferring [Solirubrobacteraceae bacterium]